MENSRIYLDSQATTFLDPAIRRELVRVMEGPWANPASQHELGRQARRRIEFLREQIGLNLGLGPADRVIFTSGGTESNNLALVGWLGQNPSGNIVSSSIEHPSVLQTLEFLHSRFGIELRFVDPQALGSVNPVDFIKAIDEDTIGACCMLANNETGVLQPIEPIANYCLEQHIPFHVDAVQAIGKVPFHFLGIGCASASVSAHKIHGPVGAGALLVRGDFSLQPMMFGGFQQDGIRPGTESLLMAAGLHGAILHASEQIDDNLAYMSELRDLFEKLLLESEFEVVINGDPTNRLPNSSNLSFPGVDRQKFILAADVHGLACSTGSACSSGSSEPSHVLSAMNLDRKLIDSAIRFGFSKMNTCQEVEEAVKRILRILKNLRP